MKRQIRIIYQHDSMQCGIACLQMICGYYGKKYSSEYLSKLCFATTEGVSMLGINDAANTLGFHTFCVKIATKELEKFLFHVFSIGIKIIL